jgi:hypothetical protein
MSASVPRLADQPAAPSNRRIVILVLKKDVEDALKGTTLVSRTPEEIMRDTAPAPAEGAAPGAAEP